VKDSNFDDHILQNDIYFGKFSLISDIVFVNVDRTQKVEEMDNLGTDEPPLASSMLETISPIFSKEDESDIIVISKYEMIEQPEQIGELLKVVEDHLFHNGVERELEEKVSALSQTLKKLKTLDTLLKRPTLDLGIFGHFQKPKFLSAQIHLFQLLLPPCYSDVSLKSECK